MPLRFEQWSCVSVGISNRASACVPIPRRRCVCRFEAHLVYRSRVNWGETRQEIRENRREGERERVAFLESRVHATPPPLSGTMILRLFFNRRLPPPYWPTLLLRMQFITRHCAKVYSITVWLIVPRDPRNSHVPSVTNKYPISRFSDI